MGYKSFIASQILLMILLMLVCMFIQNQETKESTIGLFGIINFVLYLYMIKQIKAEYISIYSFFIIFLYLFNLGLPISRFCGWIDIDKEDFMNRRIYPMGKELFINYLLYAYCLISCIEIGVFKFIKTHIISFSDNSRTVDPRVLSRCRLSGYICIAIGLIPFFYIESTTIRNAVVYGYQSSDIVDNLSGTGLGLLSSFVYIGIFILLLSYQKKKLKFIIISYMFALYEIVRMFITGDRSTGLMLLLVLIFIYHYYVSKITGKQFLIGLFGCYFFLAFLKMIEITRSETVDAATVFNKALTDNPFISTIFEYGGNVWSGMMVFYSMSYTFYRCGTTYVASIVGKPLSILGITNEIWAYADYSNFITDSNNYIISELRSAMGGSFSGEVFFNFGYLGVLLMPVFGYYLAKFSIACSTYRNNLIKTSFLLYISTLVLWWVRQYFPNIAWHAIFYGATLYLLYRIIVKRLYLYKY